jgi:hypothetical protein
MEWLTASRSKPGLSLLAARSKSLLERYRRGEPVPEGCPLRKASMTPQDERLDFLRTREPTPAAKATLKRTVQQFVLAYGWWYEPAGLPQGVAPGTPQ